ncbi:uncharacterized protein LOC133186503 [Saccostrea echinata]|uniref:uncharacterized protein LOC133186503 n=1 Tax=Saccostrea echinata TaxID=191078 RepID=UPI002A7FFEBB|nr:uncharacterized protein LOC133186503 [Saccostrea echinata]
MTQPLCWSFWSTHDRSKYVGGSGNKDENQKISNFGEKHHAVTARTQYNAGRRNDGEGAQLINNTEGRENYTDIDFGISRVWVIVSNATTYKSAAKIQTISQRYSNENLVYINDIQGSWRTGMSQKEVIIFRSGYFSTLEHIKKDFDELYDHLQTHTKLCLVFDIYEDKWRRLVNDIKLIQLAKMIYIP